MRETWVQSLGREDPLEKEMATHSSTLAWKIPWIEEPGRLQSMVSQRVGHNWATSVSVSVVENLGASQVALVVRNLPANGDLRDVGSIPGSGRSPGGGHGNPLKYSCLENPMDRGVWWATVHGVTRSQRWLKWLSIHEELSQMFP